MTDMTPERLAELRAVAEAASEPDHYVCDCTELCGDVCPRPMPIYRSIDNETVLALVDALEAKTAEVDAKADYVSDLEERVRQRDNHVTPVLHARIKEAERERDEARAGMAEADQCMTQAMSRADRAEAALERVKAVRFTNHLYFTIVSNPLLNNEVGELLYDRITALITQALEAGADDA